MSGNTPSAFGFKSNGTNTNTAGAFGAFAPTPSVLSGGTNVGQNNTTNHSDSSAATNTPLFGGNGSAQNPGQGAQQSASSGGGGGGIFGSSSGTSLLTPTMTPPGVQTGNIFGGVAQGTPGGANFGGASASAGVNSTSPAPNPLFGSGGNQPVGPSTSSNSMFGGTNALAAPSGKLFGSTSTNQPVQMGATTFGGGGLQNSAPSGNNIFGNTSSNAPSAGIFGSVGAGGTATNAPTPPLSILGASSNNQGSSNQTSSAAANSGNTVTPSASKPPFGNVASNSTPSNPLSQPSPFNSWGAKPSDSSSQPATSVSAPTSAAPVLPSLFGWSNTTNVNKIASSRGATSTTPPPSGTPSLFANLPKKPDSALVPGAPSTTPSAFSAFPSSSTPKDSNKEAVNDAKHAPTGGLFGSLPGASDGSKDISKDAVPSKDGTTAPFSLGGAKDVNTAKPSPTSGTVPASGASATTVPSASSPVVTSVPAPSTLRGKTVEDIVNRWTTELATHTREFSQFAGEVAVWDKTLIENGNYISALYATVLAAESTQTSLDQSLDHVEQQQRHLMATLDQYEKSATEILHGPGGIMTSTEGLGLADSERDKSYALAANLYTQLDDLSRSLTQMVESVNGLNLSPGPSQAAGADNTSQEDAISTISGILNAHLSSLQWIDGSLKEMDGKVRDAERKIKDGAKRRTSGEGISRSRSYGLGSSWL